MNAQAAMELAREKFKEYFSNRKIPSEISERLSLGSSLSGNRWIVEVSLLPCLPNSEGLEKDLHYPQAEVMVRIEVDRKTGLVDLVEMPGIRW